MKWIDKLKGLLNKSTVDEISTDTFGVTDAGRLREGNEDYFIMDPEKQLFIVSDGMGGHNAGEVASLNATEAAHAYFNPELLSTIRGDSEKIRDEVIKGILDAHKKVFELAKTNPAYRGMGCTMVVALLDGNILHLGHVGDARAYLLNKSGLQLLTTDHSNVMLFVQAGELTMEEARQSPMKNELTQAVGASEVIEPDYNRSLLESEDKILLCSDGLWDMLSNQEIHDILKQEKPARAICEELIEKANDAGGHDNITVAVIIHKEKRSSQQ